MRRMITMAAAAALVGTAAMAPTPASAASAVAAPVAAPGPLQPAQFFGAGPHWGDDGWERRRQWREWRQHQDEMRIAEAARREAWRIEQEREQRRAWRRAMREQHGHGYGPNPAYGFGHFRSW